MIKKKNKVIFPKPTVVGHRNWGIEKILIIIPKILSLKLLQMKKGKKGGLQYHRKKNECGYVLSGKLKVRFDNGNGIIKEKILAAIAASAIAFFSVYALTPILIKFLEKRNMTV